MFFCIFFFEMEKLKNRAVIEYLHRKGLKGVEIFTDMVNVLGDDAPSRATVFNWVAELKRGRTTIDDEPRSGRPRTATTQKIINEVHDMVNDDRRLRVSNIAEALGISVGRAFHILKDELGLKKLLTRWVPHSLTLDQKRTRVRLSEQYLDRFRKDKEDFVRRYVTQVSWVFHYDPELRKQNAEWIESGCSAPKQPKTTKSAKKVLASIFWDAQGILLVDYLQSDKTTTGEYYSNLIDRLDTKICEKRPGLMKKRPIFHHDNAAVHRDILVMAKLEELHYELLENPAYSPDLSPSDFHLLPCLKKFVVGRHFSSNNEFIATLNEYFEGLPENHFRNGIHELENRWEKCLALKGEYIEE